MNQREKLKALLAEAEQLRGKDELTEAEVKRAGDLVGEIKDLEASIKAQDEVSAKLKNLAPAEEHKGDEPEGKTLGERFVKSEAYKRFKAAHPAGVGKGTPIEIKAERIGRWTVKADPAPLNTDNANLLPTRLPGIDDLSYRWPTNVLDLITRGTANSPLLQYRQLVSITSNAKITAESKTTAGTDTTGGLKPLSTLTTQTKNASAFTYADGIEVTNQELADDGALTALINGILTQNLDIEMERVLISGAGTDDEPAGILNTTGVLHQAFDTDAITTIRKAKTLLRTSSLTEAQAVVLSPEDDETFDLLKDGAQRFFGNGPFGVGPQTIWGIPRVVSTRVPAGTAIIGDFSQVQLLNLEPTSVLVFNQHKDYAQRNLSYVRAECRCLQLIRQPAKLAVVKLTSGN